MVSIQFNRAANCMTYPTSRRRNLRFRGVSVVTESDYGSRSRSSILRPLGSVCALFSSLVGCVGRSGLGSPSGVVWSGRGLCPERKPRKVKHRQVVRAHLGPCLEVLPELIHKHAHTHSRIHAQTHTQTHARTHT
jgi:hypothetical protein